MKNITANLITKFIKIVADKLPGDWVIIGGSVLPLVGLDIRITTDIDIAGPEKGQQNDILILMEIAEALGLPPEAINQAGAFFLRKIKNWQKSLVLVHKTNKANIFRPDINLFLLLKIQRFSESDLADCLAMLDYAKKHQEKVSPGRLKTEIEALISKETNNDKISRLNLLSRHLIED